MFSLEHREIFKNIYFEKYLQTGATATLNNCSWMSRLRLFEKKQS